MRGRSLTGAAEDSSAAAPVATARRILLNTGFRAVADLGAKVATIALQVVMARRLGASGFGVFAFGLAFVTLVTTLANLGQQAILTREVARDRERIHGYFANTIALQLTLAVPALAVAFFVYALIGPGGEAGAVVALLGVAVVAEALMSTCFAVYQAHERLGYIPVVIIFQRWATAAIGVTALLLGAGVVAVAAIYLVIALLALALALRLLLANIVRPRLEVELRRWKPLMRAALPIGLAGLFATILFRVDITMLAWYESETQVGFYGAAYRLFESTLFISWSIGAAVYPVLSRLSEKSQDAVARVFEGSLKLGLACTLPLAAGAVLLAHPLMVLLYGESFGNGSLALALLGPAIFLYPISYVAGYVLVSQDQQSKLTWIYAVVAIENISLNLVLIPAFSLDGAAAGTSISSVLTSAAMLFFALRVSGGVDAGRVVTGPALATGAAAATMYFLHDHLGLAVLVSVPVYVGLLGAYERRFNPADYGQLWEFVRRKRAVRSAGPAPDAQ